jgi:hypothetical protein
MPPDCRAQAGVEGDTADRPVTMIHVGVLYGHCLRTLPPFLRRSQCASLPRASASRSPSSSPFCSAPSPAAHAVGLFRAYVASTGSDRNPCTLPSPCRLLPAAINATMDGGEVWMLDSANYNTGTVAITKSVSVLAVPGAVGSLVGNGCNAIEIVTPGVTVNLRNLVLRAIVLNSDYAIRIGAANVALTVQDSQITGFSEGIIVEVFGGCKVTAVRTTFLQTLFPFDIQGVTGNISYGVCDQCTMNVAVAGVYSRNARVTVSNSSVTGMTDTAVYSGADSTVSLTGVTFANNNRVASMVLNGVVISSGTNAQFGIANPPIGTIGSGGSF